MVAQTCTVCSFMKCVDKPKSTKKAASASVGAIVGGLFGGLAMAGIIGFLVYTRWIKKKKARMSMAVSHAAEKDNDFGMLKSARVDITRIGVLREHTDYLLGFDSYRRFNCINRSYPCIKCYPNRLHSWCYQSFGSSNSITSGSTRSTSSRHVYRQSLSSYITVPSVSTGWRFPVLGR